ncbi:putative carboxypeptidase PM20D1-like protein, partial [Leptotrombidium deliense]
MNVCVRIFGYVLVLISILLSICVFRALVYFGAPKDAELCTDSEQHSAIKASDALYKRFADAIRFKTITKAQRDYDTNELLSYHAFLEKSFPVIHSSPLVKKQIINKYSLLYLVKGNDTSLRPYMLCSHLDVVPVEREKWIVDPFSGTIKDGYLYGRGTMDVKQTLMAAMESLEFLLSKGFKPKRSFFLAFGHDEEGNGVDGAAEMSKVLQKSLNGVELEFLLDEGSPILNGSIKGVDQLVAMVSVTEKGYVTIKLEVNGSPGHSSLAPRETAIVTLANALTKFHSKAFPSFLGYGVEKDMLESVAPYASFPYKLVLSNLWLFGQLVSYVLSLNPVSNSFIRTSTAVTMVNGGIKPNVLPSSAYAIINHRIHPSQSVREVISFVKKLINDDRIAISLHEGAFEPHPVSPFTDDSFGYQVIKRSIRETFPKTAVVPGILVASTDTKWYLSLTKSVYRFCPTILRPNEFQMYHGHNERISLKNYLQTVNFYHHLMLN